MLHSAALHAARPLALAALSVVGIVGPGAAAAHALATAPVPTPRTEMCRPASHGAMGAVAATRCSMRLPMATAHMAGHAGVGR